MEALCRSESNGPAVLFSMMELLVAETFLSAERSLLWLLLLVGSLSSEIDILGERPEVIYGVLGKSKAERVHENKDDGESDDDDEEEDEDDGEDQDDDADQDDFSGDEGNANEGDDDEDPEANGGGGSEEEEDDDDDDDDEDDDDEDDEDDEEDDEDEEELPQPPSKKRK
ncbi:nucleolin [Cocos nucifera]|uniref:Nucleolin n=1 Tax=Cocos nucifera TaxID=13894 RepID=A0A8K0IQ12_COCNU|nr:nucleolin [Cocos nucifera]